MIAGLGAGFCNLLFLSSEMAEDMHSKADGIDSLEFSRLSLL